MTPQATLRINGTQTASGQPSADIPIAPGNNVITVSVTAGDGITVKDYTLTVTRPAEADASLASLAMDAGTLSPAFNPLVTDYSAEVELQTSAIKVTAAALDPAGQLKINGIAAQSGVDSEAIPLQVGVNHIPVEVTASDSTTVKTYTLHITRKSYNTVVVDFGDSGYAESGSWSISNTVKGVNGSSTRYTTAVGSAITWKPKITAGTASVSFYKVNWPDSADPRVRLEIAYGSAIETRYVDLTPTGEGWVDLGTYTFTGSGNEYVRLTRVTTSPTTIFTRADAVKFEGTIERLPPKPGPIRSRQLPNLQYEEKGTIQNGSYKATFYEAVWDGGRTFVRDIYRLENGVWVPVNTAPDRLEEQWVILNGSAGDRANYYDTMDYEWVTFDSFTMPDDKTVVLSDTRYPDRYAFNVTWSLTGDRPVVSYAFTPQQDGHYVIGYQGFTAENAADVTEVLSGARNRAKMTGTVESTGLWELTAPMSLVEKRNAAGSPFTYGLYIPAEELPLQYEPTGGANNQRLGMSLINNDGAVQPIVYAPQYGTNSQLTAGSTYQFQYRAVCSAGYCL